MSTRINFRFLLTVSLVAMVFLSATSRASAAPSLSNELRVTEEATINYAISFLSWPQFPSYSNGKVVWKDDRNGNSDIYMYDFNSEVETQITTDEYDQIWPSISGDYIVWMDDRQGDWDIYMYDLATETESIVTSEIGNDVQPCISGDVVVWEKIPGGLQNFSLNGTRDLNLQLDSDIYRYDISEDTVSVVSDFEGTQYSPWIDGNIIVWEDNRDETSQIYYMDLANPVEDGAILSPSETDQYWPTVTGTKVTWTEDRLEDTSYDIFLFDLATDTESQITDDPEIQAFGHISGNYIVWTDNRDGSWDVFIAYLPTGIEYPLIVRDAPQGVARIYGNRVIWGDSRNDTGLNAWLSNPFTEIEYTRADIYSGILLDDTTPPTFDDLPDEDKPIDIDDGQTITTTPFTLTVKPTDTQSPIASVVFKTDGKAMCSDTSPDGNGLFSCLWAVPDSCPTGKNTISLTVEATDIYGNIGILTRTVTPSVTLCPSLAETGTMITAVLATAICCMSMLLVGKISEIRNKEDAV